MKDISIIIPAYNEEARITKTLIDFNHYLSQTPYTYEIIVSDDGSTDRTIEKVKALQLQNPHLRYIKLKQNKGKGQAVREGMLGAEGKIRLFSDADGSTPIEEMDKLIHPILSGKTDIVIGSRYLKNSNIVKSQPLYRRVWSRLANKVVQRLLLPGIPDPNCGFKAFSAESATKIFSQCTVNEWSFDLEVLGIARSLNIPLKQVPVKWINDERTKGKISHLPTEIKNLFRIKKRIQTLSITEK